MGSQTLQNPHAGSHLVVLLHPLAVVVDACAVRTVVQRSVVDTHDAARRIIPCNPALHSAACNGSCALIDARDAADGIAPAHRSLKCTVLDGAVVDAANAAHALLFVF